MYTTAENTEATPLCIHRAPSAGQQRREGEGERAGGGVGFGNPAERDVVDGVKVPGIRHSRDDVGDIVNLAVKAPEDSARAADDEVRDRGRLQKLSQGVVGLEIVGRYVRVKPAEPKLVDWG
ncbi:MAG: hypothetical protein IT577_05730 [Verrucomicrobiae bacterium]|nr:hypothetical protein [Verrucomicrobiae bacterium]